MRKLMAELKSLNGPLGHLVIGPKIGKGGYGVVHAGEGGLIDKLDTEKIGLQGFRV